jgi:hypothetical protein
LGLKIVFQKNQHGFYLRKFPRENGKKKRAGKPRPYKSRHYSLCLLPHPFPDGRCALAVADAHAFYRVFDTIERHLVHNGGGDSRARTAQRMTQRYAATFGIEHFVMADA